MPREDNHTLFTLKKINRTSINDFQFSHYQIVHFQKFLKETELRKLLPTIIRLQRDLLNKNFLVAIFCRLMLEAHYAHNRIDFIKDIKVCQFFSVINFLGPFATAFIWNYSQLAARTEQRPAQFLCPSTSHKRIYLQQRARGVPHKCPLHFPIIYM